MNDFMPHPFQKRISIRVTWRDKRLKFHNLRKDENSNVVDRDVLESIWVPPLNFLNVVGNSPTEGEDPSLLILKQTEGRVTGPEEIDESIQYEGSENSLVLVKRYQLTHDCPFNLLYYPFDTQLCKLEVKNATRLAAGLYKVKRAKLKLS